MTHHLRSLHRQRGVALIISLLVVAIVAALALLFTARQQLWMRQIENRNNFTMAIDVATAAINMSRLTLRDDARRNKYDHLLEPWTIPIPPIAVEQGKVAGRISELQGRFNLTNLLPAQNVAVREDNADLVRASRALSLAPSIIGNVLRQYQSLRKREPYSTPDMAELMRLAAVPAEVRTSFDRCCVVLMEKTPVNVNFASAEVLQAAIEGLSSGEASRIVSERTGSPYATVEAFTKTLPESVRSAAGSDRVTVMSRYFMVDIDAWFNDMHTGFQAMVRRDGTTIPLVLWERRSKLGPS